MSAGCTMLPTLAAGGLTWLANVCGIWPTSSIFKRVSSRNQRQNERGRKEQSIISSQLVSFHSLWAPSAPTPQTLVLLKFGISSPEMMNHYLYYGGVQNPPVRVRPSLCQAQYRHVHGKSRRDKNRWRMEMGKSHTKNEHSDRWHHSDNYLLCYLKWGVVAGWGRMEGLVRSREEKEERGRSQLIICLVMVTWQVLKTSQKRRFSKRDLKKDKVVAVWIISGSFPYA